MKRHQRVLITGGAVLAALVMSARLRLAAQDQPQPGQESPQQPRKAEQPRSALATANYNLLIASGFLCDPPGPDVCPSVASAENGESIEISGVGTLDPAGKSITAAGAFAEKSPNGYIVTTGVWTATHW